MNFIKTKLVEDSGDVFSAIKNTVKIGTKKTWLREISLSCDF